MSRRIVGPFNRVEGDLEIKLDIEQGSVKAAWVNSPLYRGFEKILGGRDPRDALVYTPRICGICSVSQSMAAAIALAEAGSVEPPLNGRLMRNLVLGVENVADHFTHFYLFFMPDFARPVYAGEPWHLEVVKRFKAVEGAASREVLPVRAAFMHIMGTLAGHWPHTLGLQPGGTTHSIDGAAQVRVLASLATFRRFLETRMFGDRLESVTALSSKGELDAWRQREPAATSDFGLFLKLADALSLDTMGRATDRFLSYGAYALDDAFLFKQGVHAQGNDFAFDAAGITEDSSSGWFAPSDGPRHPSRGVTMPDAEAKDAYTWCKAPRLAGQVVEVGALARQVVDDHPLIRDLVQRSGGNVANRVIARLIEIARVVQALEAWAKRITPREPFFVDVPALANAEGVGLIEAARGSLGHWLSVKNGRISNYQIVAPTTWNFSPRDAAGVPGACEQALVGAPVRDGEIEPVAVQHIVRSFDPCMVCTVH